MKQNNSKHSYSIKGFTLTELMIAMALGIFVITGMLSVFLSTKRTSELNSAVSGLQESSRFALDSLTRDVRMAGFQGCLDINDDGLSIQAKNPPTTDLSSSMIGGSVVVAANQWVPAPIGNFTIPSGTVTAVPGTHTLSVQSGSAGNATVSGVMSAAGAGTPSLSGDIPIADNGADLKAGDFAIISDCVVGDLFKVTTAPSNNGLVSHGATDNQSGNLSKAYGSTAEELTTTRLMKFNSNIYFIGTDGDTTEKGDPIRSLYVQSLPYDNTNPPIELIEGVENMRVRFGISQNNGSLVYVTANDSRYNSALIQSVQIGLLMVSYDRIRTDDDAQTYVLAGQPIPASSTAQSADALSHSGNEQYRLAFNTTTKLRNRR